MSDADARRDSTRCRLLDGAGGGVASVEGEAITRALDVNGNGRTLTVWLQRHAPIGGEFILLSRDTTASYYSRYFGLAKAADAHGHAPGLRRRWRPCGRSRSGQFGNYRCATVLHDW